MSPSILEGWGSLKAGHGQEYDAEVTDSGEDTVQGCLVRWHSCYQCLTFRLAFDRPIVKPTCPFWTQVTAYPDLVDSAL